MMSNELMDDMFNEYDHDWYFNIFITS